MEKQIVEDGSSSSKPNVHEKEGHILTFPSQAHFLMIDKCNAKCIMCGGDYFKSKSQKRITLEKFKRIATNLKLENMQSVCLAGAGDPLLNKDLVPIVAYLRSNYPALKINITTNGIALTGALSEQLQDFHLDIINVSLNAASREEYQRIMQVDCFDSVCRRIDRFLKLRQASGVNTIVQVSSVLNRLNIKGLPSLVELCARMGVDSINTMYCRFYPESIRNMSVANHAERLLNEDSLYFHQALSDRMVKEAKTVADRFGLTLAHETLFSEPAVRQPCHWPFKEIMIGFDGEVYPCGGAEVHFKNKIESGAYDFGNALEQNIESFWNKDQYLALRTSSFGKDCRRIPECDCCANVLSVKDKRFHIMDWGSEFHERRTGPDGSIKESQYLIKQPDKPLVSIIVPTYNRPELLRRTLESISRQNYLNIEAIVVNDFGQDVYDVIEAFRSRLMIKYICHEQNRGLAATRNSGLKAADGKYIAYLDDDDIFYPNHIETLVHFLESEPYKVAYTDAHRAWEEDQDGHYVITQKDVPYSFDFDYEQILKSNFIPVLCIMHAKECIDVTGFFDEQLRSHEDWDLWVRMSRAYKFGHIKELTCQFSWRQDVTTMTVRDKADMDETRGIITRRAQKYIRRQTSEENANNSSAQLAAPQVSIIIPVYNNWSYTEKCLDSIFSVNDPIDFEIIIVDDASNDETLESLHRYSQDIRIVRQVRNSGFAKSCNAGAKAAIGNYLVFLNNDTMVLPNWLSAMYACQKSDDTIGLIGNLQVYPDTGLVQHAGKVCGKDEKLYSIYNQQLKADHPVVNKPREFQFVTGSCIMIERNFFFHLGGFDEDYLNSCEDVDLCMKVRKAGRKVYYCPDSKILHYESKSVAGHSINSDNYRLFIKRWQNDIIHDDFIYLREDGFLPEVDEAKTDRRSGKIAFLTTFNQPCGIATHTEFVITGLTRALSQFNGSAAKVVMLAEECSDPTGEDTANVFRCWNRNDGDFTGALAVIERERISLVHIQFQAGLFFNTAIIDFARKCRGQGVKVYATFHSSESHLSLCVQLIGALDKAFVHLEQSAVRFIAYGADPEKIEVIPHGVLPDRATLSLNEAKQRVKIPFDVKLISSFGFFEPHKGVDGILKALPAVFEEHPNSLFAFLGGCKQNSQQSLEYFNYCRDLARQLGVNEKVMFAEGFIPEEMASLYLLASDVVVLNYTQEINEISGAASFALAHCRPVVTSSAPAFKPLANCTLQLSLNMNIARAVRLILQSPSLSRYLVDQSRIFIRQNSFEVLGGILLNEYGIMPYN